MSKRKIIKIDENKCNGCGLCIPNCPEGALQMIDDKARLISDLFCDGLGACIGHCPQGAIDIEEREAVAYDEKRVMVNIIKQGKNVIKAHLKHLKDHGAEDYLNQALEVLKEKNIDIPCFEKPEQPDHAHSSGGCPGSKIMELMTQQDMNEAKPHSGSASQLRQWPIQLMLVPPFAPYLNDADILIAADCAPFAYADFHRDLLKDKTLLIGCPKLDDSQYYTDKITEMIKNNNMKSITCVHMEVPCCFGLVQVIKQAISASGKEVPFKDVTIGIKGGMK